MGYSITAIPALVAGSYWNQLGPFVTSALEHSRGEITPPQILKKVSNSEAQLWGILQEDEFIGAAVTEVIAYPNLKALRITTLGGKGMRKWQTDLDDVLVRFAKFVGAKRIESVGRKGFVTALLPLNYKTAYVFMVKEIESE